MKRLYFFIYIIYYTNSISAQVIDSSNNLFFKENISVNRISINEIKSNYGSTLSQLLNQQLGMIVQGAYQPKGALVNIYMEGALGGKVMILLNYIPIYDPSEIAAAFDLNLISLNDIESIDIFKGSLSSIFGSGATAGVININTKKQNSDSTKHFEIYHSLGNQKTNNTSFQLWRKYKRHSFSINYSSLKSSGFSYTHDTTGIKGYDNDGFKSKEISSKIDFLLSKHFSITSRLRYSKYKSDSDIENFIDSKEYYYKKSNLIGDIGFSFRKKNTILLGSYRYNQTNRGYYYDPYENEHYKGIEHFGDVHIQFHQKKGPIIIIGFDCRNNYLRYKSFNTQSGTSSIIYPNTFEKGAYFNLLHNSKDSIFSISIGGRINKMSTIKLISAFHLISTIKISSNVKSTFCITTGYKYPSIYQLHVENFGNSSLLPEQAASYRLSLDFAKKSISCQLSGFYRKEYAIVNFENNTSAYNNFEKLNCWGLEWFSKIAIFKKAIITTGYTFLAGIEIKESRKTFFDIVTYNYLVRRPKHVLNMEINYQVSKNFSGGISTKMVSKFYDYGLATDDYKLNAYSLFGTHFSFQLNKHMKFMGNAQNITNNQFFDTRGYNSIPFLFNLGLGATF